MPTRAAAASSYARIQTAQHGGVWEEQVDLGVWAASEGAQHPLCTRGSQPVRVRAQPAACDPAATPISTTAAITNAAAITTATITAAAAATIAVAAAPLYTAAARRDLCSSAGTMLVLKAPGRQAEP